MKLLALPCVVMLFLLTGCTTKVYNQTPPVGQTTVIEKERPVVVDRPATPEVQNNIRVEGR